MTKRLTKSQVARIKLLHKNGLSERKIAERVGCSRSAVWYWLQK